MIPVYRIRDGRSSLSKNDEVFDTCSRILGEGKALVMFPEANHSLKRRVRPLSKGFTRIVFRTLQQNPGIDLQLVPVGLNYEDATGFPDSAAVYYGKPISAESLYNAADLKSSEKRTKMAVFSALKKLTTHINPEPDYDRIIAQIESKKLSFLRPEAINEKVKTFIEEVGKSSPPSTSKPKINFFKMTIAILNFPVWFLWKFYMKPKVWEPEFMGTLRYATAQIGFSFYYIILFIIIAFGLSLKMGLIIVLGIYLLNRILVKLA